MPRANFHRLPGGTVLCTTHSCSSSPALVVTLVRVTERRPLATRGSRVPSLRLAWRLLRGALRTTRRPSPDDGSDLPASPAAASRAASVSADWPSHTTPRGRLLF